MKKKNNSVLLFLFYLLSSAVVYGQVDGGIGGSSTATKGSKVTYNAVMVLIKDQEISSYNWSVSSGGKILKKAERSIQVEWTSTGGKTISYSGRVRGSNGGMFKSSQEGSYEEDFSFTKSVLVTAPVVIATPPAPTIAGQDCNSASLVRGTPSQKGITWYWQGTNSNGKSTSNSSTFYNVTSSGTYYLRARNNNGVWSNGSSSVQVTLGVIGAPTWYADVDGDGLGDPNVTKVQCEKPTGYVSNSNDKCPTVDGAGTPDGCPEIGLSNENYIYTVAPRVPVKTVTAIDNLSSKNKIETVTYYDGLGRPKQNIAIGAGGQQQDIITHIGYDEFGRQAKDYLPYAATSNQGAYRKNSVVTTTQNFYKNKFPDDFLDLPTNEVNAYSEKVFDNSPLNRVLEQAAPGKDWKKGNEHTIKFEYQTNTEKEVLNFNVAFENNNTALPKLNIATDYYASNELYKTITKDENWRTYDRTDRTTEEFKNKQGQVLLKRTYNNNQPHDTYYVYDDYGNLTYVLPPLASEKTIIYETGTKTYPASTFVTGGNPTGAVSLGIQKVGPGQYQYIADIDLHNLGNSTFKSGKIMDLPYYYPTMSNFWLGSTSVSESSNGSYAYKYVSFYVNNGALYSYAYEYNQNNIPLVLSSFDRTTPYNLPQNLSGFTEAQTHQKVTELLDKLCYQYKYDHRNRLIEKKIPGKGWEHIIYNKIDQPIMTSDVNLRAQRKMLFTKYDVFGRVAYTGEGNYQSYLPSRTALQSVINNSTKPQYETRQNASIVRGGTSIYYTNHTDHPYDNYIGEVYTINYYDDYNNVLPSGFTPPTEVYNQDVTTRTKGLSTVTKTRVLDTNDWITTVTYYDEKARPIYVYSKNDYLQTIDIVETQLDFTGKVLATKTTHEKAGKDAVVVEDRFDYDHADRLRSQKQKINKQSEELIVKNNYDELGQLESKLVGAETSNTYKDVSSGISIADNTITKTNATGWNAGLATQKMIKGDGYVEFIGNSINKYCMVGLSSDNDNTSYNTIDYAIYLRDSGKIYVYESGSHKGLKTTYELGAVFRVERKGDKIYYKKNGETFYISKALSTGKLLGDISIYHAGAQIKNLHIVDYSEGLQQVDYTYNVRGWLKKINDPGAGLGKDLFAFELLYNDRGSNLYNNTLYNGNISQTIWTTANDNKRRYYNYYYDDLNRISGASYYSWNEYSRFNVGSISYDKNGNIQRLYRRGAIVANPDINNSADYGTMDYLSYIYDGNQLLDVNDSGNKNYGFKDDNNVPVDDYSYDDNGNMTRDINKEISTITYNHLNLPTEIHFTQGNIQYKYDATGVKQKKVVSRPGSTITTDYAGNYIYENDKLQFFNTSEGYVTPNDAGEFDYIYQYKDHLGNVRLSYTKNPNIDNPETVFEDGFDSMTNWDKSENSFGRALSGLDSSKKRSGNYSGRIDPISSTNDYYVNCDVWTPINNTDATYYTISAWVFLEDTPDNSAEIYLMTRKAGETGYPTGHYAALTKEKGRWVYIEKTASVPSNVRELNARIDNNRTGKVWFDDLKIVKGNLSKTLIVEESNYYPFGLKHKGYNNITNSLGNSTAQKFGYNGKELNEELGLEWHDYGARNYDASLGRFMSIDPLAEINQRNWTPYHYVKNNPVKFIDPSGMIWKDPSKAEDLKKKINNRKKSLAKTKTKLQGKLGKEGISDKKKARLEKRIAGIDSSTKSLDGSIADIDALGADQENTFDLVSNSNETNHVKKGSDGVINIQGSNSALHIHEIKHTALSLASDKGLQFKDDFLIATSPYGIKDEIAGYKAQYAYSPSSLPASVSNGSGIDIKYIANLKKSDGTPVYPAISSYLKRRQKRIENYKKSIKKKQKNDK